jgi:hypothetical protein
MVGAELEKKMEKRKWWACLGSVLVAKYEAHVEYGYQNPRLVDRKEDPYKYNPFIRWIYID